MLACEKTIICGINGVAVRRRLAVAFLPTSEYWPRRRR